MSTADGIATVIAAGMVIGLGFALSSLQPAAAQAEAGPPAPLTLSAAPEELLPEPSSAYVRTRIITDTVTKREYIVVYTSSGTIAITPRLPAETK